MVNSRYESFWDSGKDVEGLHVMRDTFMFGQRQHEMPPVKLVAKVCVHRLFLLSIFGSRRSRNFLLQFLRLDLPFGQSFLELLRDLFQFSRHLPRLLSEFRQFRRAEEERPGDEDDCNFGTAESKEPHRLYGRHGTTLVLD